MALSIDRTLTLDAAGLTYLQWPVAAPPDDIVYGFDVSTALEASGDAIGQITLDIKPSGSGELACTALTAAADVIEATLSGGVPGRLYTIRYVVQAADSSRVFSWLAYLPIASVPNLPPQPVAPDAGFGTPVIYVAPQRLELESGTGFWLLESGGGDWLWG